MHSFFVLLLASAVGQASAGYQTCNGRVVGDDVSRCPDGSIPLYRVGSPAAYQGTAPPKQRDPPSRESSFSRRALSPANSTPVNGVALQSCRQLSCSLGTGLQPGFETIEISGQQPSLAGRSMFLFIIAPDHTVIERKTGVFVDGHFTDSIQTRGLADGSYLFDYYQTSARGIPLASGSFTVSRRADQPALATNNRDFIGTWYGTAQTVGTIVIKPNGTYDYNGNPGGEYKILGGSRIKFAGSLSAWGNGLATLDDKGNLEFSWTNRSGAKQWFSFAK